MSTASNGAGNGWNGVQKRPGAQALMLLSAPLNYNVLKALEGGPRPLVDLRRAVGSPPQTTMRIYMKALIETGVVERRLQNAFPGSVEHELTPAGEKLLEVADILQHWLDQGTYGPISLGTPAARSAVKALVEGWSTNIVRALAVKPLALTELNRFIPTVTYPTLERRLSAMNHVGLVEPHRNGKGRGTPHRVTNWLRAAISPLTAAVGWEYHHLPEQAAPIGRRDVEATFLLIVPTLELSPDVSGRARLSVELRNDGETSYAGVSVKVEDGQIASCVSRLEGESDAWVAGTPLGWFRWVSRHDRKAVEIGGDYDLARGLAEGIHNSVAAVQKRCLLRTM